MDVDRNATLGEVLSILTDKYKTQFVKEGKILKDGKIVKGKKMQPLFKDRKFTSNDLNTTLKQLGIDKDSDIYILTGNDVTEDMFNNLPMNQFQFNQNQPFNQFQNNMNMNNMQNNVQNQPFNSSTRLKEIYTFLKSNGFCSNLNENQQLINFLNELYRANYNKQLYCTYIPLNGNDHAWRQFKRLTNNNRSFFEAAYRILKLFPAEQTPVYVIKDIGNYLSTVTNGQFMTYVEQNHNKKPVVNNNFNNQFNNGPFIPLNNNVMMNQNNMNNMQNNVQNQPFCKSDKLLTIFNYLTNNNFCLPGYNDRIKLINFLNNLYKTKCHNYIPYEKNNQTAWKNFRSVKSGINRNYMEAVYRIFNLFPQIQEPVLSSFFNCAGINPQDLYAYANSRKNIPNNPNMNMMNNNQIMMNNMNMDNNFNNQLINGFFPGGWFTWDKRPIETLINAAGLNIDKCTLYNHICKKIHEIDWQLRQSATCNNEKQYIAYINKYNQALRFLSLYFADIIENFDPKHYSYYFKNYNSMYRFLPPYIDPINKSQQYGKVTFYNTAAGCYREIPLAQLDNTNDLPEICNNVGQSCYANACRNMILSNKMLRVVLSKIGEELLLRNIDMRNAIMGFMNDNTKTAGYLCNIATHCVDRACARHLSTHAQSVVKLARQKKWGVLEMLCLYARCAELASQINDRNNRSNFLGKIFAATMVIIGDKDPLFRTAGASDANDLSRNLNEILTQSLSRHIKREAPIAVIDPMETEKQSKSLYGSYNICREVHDDLSIPGQLAVKVNRTVCQGGHNKFGPQADPFIQLTTASYNSPGLKTQGGMIYDLQSALSLENLPTLLQGENATYCNTCKRLVNARMDAQYVCGSLLSQLKPHYGKGNIDRKRVVCNEYVVNWSVPTTHLSEVYQLKCFIVHQGGNDATGHFISYHKVHTGGNPPYQWYRLDDGLLTLANNNTVQDMLRNPSFGIGSVPIRLYYERVPFSQMIGDQYGKLSVTHLAIPSHEDFKLGDPLYMSFFNRGNNNFGEPNPNNPYTAVLGLQKLLMNLGLGHLVNQQANQNVQNQYMGWNTQTNCATYNNNLNPVQPMNNMFMNNFMFPQMFPNNNNVNMNMMNQGNKVPMV